MRKGTYAMWEVISLGATLFFIASVFPPYNVFIAQSISEKNLLLYLSTMIPSLSGLFLGGLLLGYGSILLGLPLELIGGVFIIVVGLRMLWPKKNQLKDDRLKKKVTGSAQAALSCFLLSFMPGVFTIAMGTAFNTANFPQVLTVSLGAALGINLGGILLFKGAKLAHLPLDKLGGVLLLFVGVLTII
jgi:hypothetical protein